MKRSRMTWFLVALLFPGCATVANIRVDPAENVLRSQIPEFAIRVPPEFEYRGKDVSGSVILQETELSGPNVKVENSVFIRPYKSDPQSIQAAVFVHTATLRQRGWRKGDWCKIPHTIECGQEIHGDTEYQAVSFMRMLKGRSECNLVKLLTRLAGGNSETSLRIRYEEFLGADCHGWGPLHTLSPDKGARYSEFKANVAEAYRFIE